MATVPKQPHQDQLIAPARFRGALLLGRQRSQGSRGKMGEVASFVCLKAGDQQVIATFTRKNWWLMVTWSMKIGWFRHFCNEMLGRRAWSSKSTNIQNGNAITIFMRNHPKWFIGDSGALADSTVCYLLICWLIFCRRIELPVPVHDCFHVNPLLVGGFNPP